MPKHTLIAYVEDVPGVLNRVASLFRRRNFNIDSLTVGRTEQAGVSRLTVVVDATDAGARIVEANLYKLVNVLRVDDLTHKPALNRELGLVKVKVTAATRSQVLEFVDMFRARVVDVDEESLVIEVTGTPEKIGKFEMVLRPYGILELVRTGSVSMARGHDKLTANPPLVRAEVRSGAAADDHSHAGISMSV
ncbi:MAG: acetolactate synthase small subunit [Candidatus Didemnitutus sp.]|nr:acetolactate synthase small subunit [Candidatus Didemnitutus sp.]